MKSRSKPRPRSSAANLKLQPEWSTRRWSLLAAAGLVALTCCCYLPAVDAGFIWDDDYHVTDNPELRSLGGLGRIWLRPGSTVQYYPMTHTVFWAEYHLWGPWAPGYHAVNLALHAANVVLLWLILRRLAVPGSFCVAAVWAVHPLNVETVAWVSELKNVLSTFFYLAALGVYLRFWPLDKPGASPGRWRDYGLAGLLFACALCSKTVACTLPATILLLHYWKRGRIERKAWALMSPWFLLAAAFAVTTIAIERMQVGATGPEWAFSPVDRVLIAGRALCFYAAKLLWPIRLAFIYPRWTIDAGRGWQYLFPAAAVAAPVVLWWGRARWGRGPLCALLFFYGTLFPALGFINVYPMRYSFVADHFQYLAGVGWLALVLSAVLAALQRWNVQRRAVAIAGAVLVTALGLGTAVRAQVYHDGPSIWRDTIIKNPSAAMAYGNLGKYLSMEGKLDQAVDVYRKCVALTPHDPEAHNNFGYALESQGKLAEAIEQYRLAIALNPKYAAAHSNLGFARFREGDDQDAQRELRRAIELDPDYADAHNNLGMLLATQGHLEAALAEYHAALRANPANAQAHFNLGTLLLGQHQTATAERELVESLRLNPGLAPAHNNLGSLWLSEHRWTAARDEFSKAVALAPGDSASRQNLAAALEQLGDYAAAMEQLRIAAQLNPADPRPRDRLERLLRRQRRPAAGE